MDGSFKMEVMLETYIDSQPFVLLAPSPNF